MSRELVLVHGRAQAGKDAVALKAEWLGALAKGLAKSGLALPIEDSRVRFPYYGDTLDQMAGGMTAEQAAAVIVRGHDAATEEVAFERELLQEIFEHAQLSDAQLVDVMGQDVVNRGPLNSEWVQGVLRAIDRFVPHGSGASVALFTHDVSRYLRDPAIREQIERGVASAITPGVETIVVGHSLGSVVAYNLVRREGHLRGWKVPLFVTVGSPLGIRAIRRTLAAMATTRTPECASAWFNALDERDVVALYPLAPKHFPLWPATPVIENKVDVDNPTRNRHGISGYLDDATVARRIYDALVA